MTANTDPIFTLAPNMGMAEVDSANTESDGTGDLDTLFTAGANGSMVFVIRWHNAQSTAAASSANVIRFFLTDADGANPRLWHEAAVPTATRSVSVIGSGNMHQPPGGLALASGQLIKVCQSVYAGAQDLMHYIAEGGDF
jgi:hypothetical protein